MRLSDRPAAPRRWSRALLGGLALVALAASGRAQALSEDAQPAGLTEAAQPAGPLRIDRGEGEHPLWIPRDEQLVFKARLNLGIIGSPSVGTVTIDSKVEPYRSSALLRDNPATKRGERASVSATARGGYAVYDLTQVISALMLPQDWPALVMRNTQTGTENRRREQLIGKTDQGYITRFRTDRHCKGCDLREHFIEPTWAWQEPRHCKKCKRAEHSIWREWESREVPEGTLDMVTAIFLGRSMIESGVDEVVFPLVDKEKLWELTVRRGKDRRVEVDAGEFDAAELKLITRPYPGEDADPEDFKGLFGIHGTVSIFFEAATGVPVLISGIVPLGPIDLDVEVQLASWRGTPAGFSPR